MAAKDDPREKRKKKEAAIVDKLLKQLPHADPTLSAAGAKPKRPPPPRSRTPLSSGRPKRQSTPLGVWVKVLVALVLGVAITQWPYLHDCGLASVPYLAIAAMIVIMAAWAAAGSWKHRMPVAHVLSLGLILWGLIVAAHDVLPRVGYARAEGTWACAIESEPAVPGAIPAVPDSTARDSLTPADSEGAAPAQSNR
jgi:hypothetical protein